MTKHPEDYPKRSPIREKRCGDCGSYVDFITFTVEPLGICDSIYSDHGQHVIGGQHLACDEFLRKDGAQTTP